jgi:hypothetical protein
MAPVFVLYGENLVRVTIKFKNKALECQLTLRILYMCNHQ